MRPNEGRLQTGEHLLAKLIESRFSDVRVGISRFFEDHGEVEFLFNWDLRGLNLDELNFSIGDIIKKKLVVKIETVSREEIADLDLSRVPLEVNQVRIVAVEDFDRRPCHDPHVNNTKEIGKFIVYLVDKVGKDRYRFKFRVE